MISFVADGAEKRGLYEDAIQLHDLAKMCVMSGGKREGGEGGRERGREGEGERGHL